MIEVLNVINNFAWVMGNILVAYIAIGLVAFVIGYYILFDPKATTAGRFIFRFFLSLVGVIAMAFISSYINPAGGAKWYNVPDHVDWWRPLIRFGVYLYVAFTITSLAVLLVFRKWWPEKLKSSLTFVKVRNDTLENRVIPDED